MIIDLPAKFIGPFTRHGLEAQLSIRKEVYEWLETTTPGIHVRVNVGLCENNLPISHNATKIVVYNERANQWYFATVSIEFASDIDAIHFKLRWWDTDWDDPRQITAEDIYRRSLVRSNLVQAAIAMQEAQQRILEANADAILRW